MGLGKLSQITLVEQVKSLLSISVRLSGVKPYRCTHSSSMTNE